MTYQGIARVSKEKCRSIDRQALGKRQVEAPDALLGQSEGLGAGPDDARLFYLDNGFLLLIFGGALCTE
jgi:hypothetical protein